MDFDQLNTFVEVAKQGSFSLAGRKVYRSQSAVSAQIRQLEQEYGEKLFGRLGKSVRLTPAGEVLFEYAGRLLALRQESLREVADQSSTPRGVLTVGANEATCLYVLPEVFEKFHRLYSNVQISIYRNFSHKILQRVEDGTIDIGIVTLPVKSPSLKVHSIYRDRVVLIVSKKNPLSKLSEVTAKDIAGQPLIFPKTGFTRQVLDKFFRPYATQLRIVMELPSITMIKRFVGANLGVSLISEGFAKDDVRAGRVKLIPIKDVEMWRELGVIYRKDRHLPRSATSLVEMMRAEGHAPGE
jgi:LysR family transcriptional regulator, low CO2-responsive transcriptional regulator